MGELTMNGQANYGDGVPSVSEVRIADEME